MSTSSNLRLGYLQYIFLAVAIISTIVLYYSGLSGPFLFDDTHVIESNKYLRITALEPSQLVRAMESFGANGRQLSMLTFALNYYAFGGEAWWFKFVNVLIHCLNGFVLYKVTSLLVAKVESNGKGTPYLELQYLPLVATSIWLISPINLTSVLYVSQRMTLLSSFFVLTGILSYIWARFSISQTPRKLLYVPLIIGGFTLAGYFCKENGALLPLFIAIIELIFFRFRSDGKLDKIIAAIFAAGFVLILLAIGYKFITNPGWLVSGYKHRDFTLGERVLTQFRVLIFYISQIILPNNEAFGLWHDDFSKSTSLFSPRTTLFSAIAVCLLAVTSLFLLYRAPLIAFGIAWFFISHSMESTVIPLEMIHEHRNYLASFGVLFLFIGLLFAGLRKFKPVLILTLVAIFSWNAITLAKRADIWSSRVSLYEHEAKAHPTSAIANYTLGIQYFREFLRGKEDFGALAKEKLLITKDLQPDKLSTELALIVASENGAFEYDPTWLEDAVKKYPHVRSTPALQAAILAFLKCLDQKVCVKSKEGAKELFDMFIDSPDYIMSSFYAFYYSGQGNDPEKANFAYKKSLRPRDAKSYTNYLLFLIRERETQQACALYKEFNGKMERFEFRNSAQVLDIAARIHSFLSDCEA